MTPALQERIEEINIKKYGEMVTRTSMEARKYKESMRELSRQRDFRARFRDIMRQPAEETSQQLTELNLNTGGSETTRAERLFRVIIRTIGPVEVPWFPETNEADGVVVPEEEELLMGDSDHDWDYKTDAEQAPMQQQAPWPSDRGLPTASEMAAVTAGTQTGQGLLRSRVPPVDRTGPRQHSAPWQDEAGGLPRITVQDERNTESRQHLSRHTTPAR